MSEIGKARIHWQVDADPIEWLPLYSPLRRVAFMPLMTPKCALKLGPAGDFRDSVVPQADFEHLAEACMWMRHLLDSLALPFDEAPRELVASRAAFFFGLYRPRRKLDKAGGHKWTGPLALKKAWQDLPPVYLKALEDLARLVAYWLRRNAASTSA